MLSKPLAALALLVIAIPAIGDEKGDALVSGWIARIPLIQPITAETTTTYQFGRLTAVYKHVRTLAPSMTGSFGRQYRFDLDFPMDLYNSCLGDNFDPLPNGGAMGQIGIDPNSGAGRPKYLGRETIEGKEYDVVEMHEISVDHFTPRRGMLASLPRSPDGRLAIKWFFDAEGVVQRMTYSGLVQVPDAYITYRTAFDPPEKKASTAEAALNAARSSAQPVRTELFTATMVVDSYHKTYTRVPRTPMGDPLVTIPNTSGSVCLFSPDSTLLAIRNQAGVQIALAATGQIKIAFENSAGSGSMDFSQDGKSFAYVTSSAVTVISTEDGRPIRSIPVSPGNSGSIRLSPDGKRLIMFNQRLLVDVWNVETGQHERTIKGEGSTCDTRFSADGKQLIVAACNADILAWDTSSWQIARRIPLRCVSRMPLAVSLDGREIATIDDDRNVLVWDGSKNEPARKLNGPIGYVTALNFASDNKSLFVCDFDTATDLPTNAPGYIAWNIETGAITATASPWQSKGFGDAGRGVISPNGKLAAFSGSPSTAGSIAVYGLPAGK